ncbi:MAG: type II secretion system F family protein [Candidatus Hydrogenedentes bacterium]|nr:type II secretion system F family protein [Candidatus Hydrogenedentota bacterium]
MGLLSRKLGVKTMAHFCRVLAQSSTGFVQIERALELAAGPGAPAELRRTVPPILDRIKQGGSLSEALRVQQRYIPDDFLELVSAAERGGKVEVAFQHLAHDYELRLEFMRSMARQLTYPLLLWISFHVISFWQGLMTTVESVEMYTLRFAWATFLSLLPLLVVYLALRHFGLLDKLCYAVASRTWPWRGILHSIALVRFFRCLAMLLEAGLAVPQAIERSAATTVNPRVRAKLAQAVPLVQQGASLTRALEATGMLPNLAVEMVRTGEFAGRLEDLLKKTAQYIEEGAYHYVRMLQYTFFALLIPAILVLIILRALATQVVMIFLQVRDMLSG